MKQTGMIGIVLLLSLSLVGCCNPPGYYGARHCGPLGCGSLLHQGVVDYVDGGPGARGTECGGTGGYADAGYDGACGVPGGYAYAGRPYRPCLARGVNCLGNLVNGVFVLGEGAFCLAASPFVLAGNLICGGCGGYETFPGCGCSNEVYYGDNCYQPQDLCDPCSNVSSTTCGCGSGVATSSCTRCSGGYTEGIQYDTSASAVKPGANYRPAAQPVRNPNPAYNVQVNQQMNQINRNRPIAQTSYRQQPMQQSQLIPQQRQVPPRPAAYDDEWQMAAGQ